MAFEHNENNNVTQLNGNNNENWKCQGFLNFYLPTNEGKRRKVGAIGLKSNKKAEAELIDFLREDPTRIMQVMEVMEVEFNMAEASDGTSFALSSLIGDEESSEDGSDERAEDDALAIG